MLSFISRSAIVTHQVCARAGRRIDKKARSILEGGEDNPASSAFTETIRLVIFRESRRLNRDSILEVLVLVLKSFEYSSIVILYYLTYYNKK